MGAMAPSHVTLIDLGRIKVKVTEISMSYISYRSTVIGHMLLLNINRKVCMGSPMALWHLTLGDLEGQARGHLDLEALHLVNEVW